MLEKPRLRDRSLQGKNRFKEHLSAIYHQGLSGDVLRFIGSEKSDRVGNVYGFGELSQRDGGVISPIPASHSVNLPW